MKKFGIQMFWVFKWSVFRSPALSQILKNNYFFISVIDKLDFFGITFLWFIFLNLSE